MLSEEKQFQARLYGKMLTGTETDLDKAKMAREWYLKQKMRKRLADEIGDSEEIASTLTKLVVLLSAVYFGLITNQTIIDKIKSGTTKMLALYGGATPMLKDVSVLVTGLEQHLAAKYYVAKDLIEAKTTAADVGEVDLPGEPVTEQAA